MQCVSNIGWQAKCQWFDMIDFIIYKGNHSAPVQDNLKVFV